MLHQGQIDPFATQAFCKSFQWIEANMYARSRKPTSPISQATATQMMNMSQRSRAATTLTTVITQPIRRHFGFKKKSKRGSNALYRAISAENWDLVVSIAESKPYKAESWHNAPGFFDAHRSSKILPLHQACVFHPTPEAISAIIGANHGALRAQEGGYGRVPLHIACHSSASCEVIRVLVSNDPTSTIKKDIIGRVPLHYALSNGSSNDIVDVLIEGSLNSGSGAGPRIMTSAADFNGWLPLHVACHMGASSAVLSKLVRAYPDAVHIRTKKGSTPLTLLKSISVPENKRKEMEEILMNMGRDTDSVLRSKTFKSKMEALGDDSVSRGVTLEVHSETSSLSSMEDTATVRTGRTNRTSRSRRYREQVPQQYPTLPKTATNQTSPTSFTKSLPTHPVYGDDKANNNSWEHGMWLKRHAGHSQSYPQSSSKFGEGKENNGERGINVSMGASAKGSSVMKTATRRLKTSMSRSGSTSSQSRSSSQKTESDVVFKAITSSAAFV